MRLLYPVSDYMLIMPKLSNDEIRYKILEILYKVASKSGSNWQVLRSYLIGHLKINENLVDFNVFYLADRDLARIMKYRGGNWEIVVITGKGIDVYEHKVDFVSQYPFIKIAVQKIDGTVYGGAVQGIDSQIDLNQKITDSFRMAYDLVEIERNIADEQKTEIRRSLGELEEEIKSKKPDRDKVRRLWDWIKENANWVIPTLREIIEDILEAMGS